MKKEMKIRVLVSIIMTPLLFTFVQGSWEERERMLQEKMMLFEIGRQATPPPTGYGEWNFELQNKWHGGLIDVSLYYKNKITGEKSYVFDTRGLMPPEKVRARINPLRQMIVEIRHHEGKVFKKITLLCRNPDKRDCYKTIYLTFGADGSVYPQTGILKGLANTTDSGLDNSQNITRREIIYQTFGL